MVNSEMPRKRKPHEKLEPDSLNRIKALLKRLSDEPRFALICANSYIELLVSVLVLHKCKNGARISDDSRTYSHAVRLVMLNELGVIKDPLFKQLDYLRDLRNKCSHRPLFELTKSEIDKLKELGVIGAPAGTSEEGQITWLLWEVIGRTWKAGENIFILDMLLA
jgi:hypothetical protein